MRKISKVWLFALILSIAATFGITSAAEDTSETAAETKLTAGTRVADALEKLRGQGAQLDDEGISEADSKSAREFITMLAADTALPDDGDSVSRGEFVKALVTLVYPAAAYTGGETYFEDVPETNEYAGYAAFAVQAGIISPAARFNPQSAVTYAEAYKMAVSAIGYGIKAAASGGWPTGYLSVANSLKITKNVSGLLNDALTGKDAAIILYRTVTADIMVQSNFGEKITYEVNKGKSVVSEYYDIHEVQGILDADKYTSLISANGAAPQGCVKIDGKTYYCDDDKGLLGCRVLAYYKGSDDVNTLVFLKREDTDVVEMFTENVKAEGIKIKYDDGETKENYDIAPAYNYIYNGKAKLITTETPAECFAKDGMLLRLADADKDGKYETVFVDDFMYIYVSSADSFEEIIYDKLSKDNMLDLSDPECEYSFYKKEDGEWKTAGWDDIGSGSALAAAVSEDGLYSRIYICENEISGTVTATEFSEGKIYIDGEEYGVHPYFLKNCEKKDASGNVYYNVALGIQYNFVAGPDGRIVLCDMQSAEDEYKYGWIVKVAESDSMGTEIQVKMFTQEGKMEIYTLAGNVITDGSGKSRAQVYNFIKNRGNTSETYLERFVRYMVNKEGQITRIDTSENASNDTIDYLDKSNRDADNSLLKYTFSNVLNYRSYVLGFGMQFNIAKTKCFMIPPFGSADAEKDECYSMMPITYYKNNTNCNGSSKLIVYDMDLSGGAGAMIVLAAGTVSVGSAIDLNAETAIVEKVSKSVNKNGEVYYEAQVWRQSGYDSYYFEIGKNYDVMPENLHPGDLIRISADMNNIVSAVAYDFDFEKFAVDPSLKVANRTSLYITRYLLGIPYNSQDGYVNIFEGRVSGGKYIMGDNFGIESMYNLYNAPIIVINAKRSLSTGKVISAEVSGEPNAVMRDYKTAGENADVVLTSLGYMDAKYYYAYRITYVD